MQPRLRSGCSLGFARGTLLDSARGALLGFARGALLGFARGTLLDSARGALLGFARGTLLDSARGAGKLRRSGITIAPSGRDGQRLVL